MKTFSKLFSESRGAGLVSSMSKCVARLNVQFIAILIGVSLAFSGCETVPIQGVSPVTNTGQNMNALAAEATQVWQDYKAGRVDYAYAVAHALYVYQTLLKTSADVKALVKAWSGDGNYADKLARIFAASNAPPEAKAKALADGVGAAAANKGP